MVYILILILFLIFLILLSFYKYYPYETYSSVIKKIDDYKMVLYLKDTSKLNDYELYIENEKINFSIYSISDDYYIINNDNLYEVILNVDLPCKYKIDNNIIKIKIKKEKTNFIKNMERVIVND